MGPARIYLSAFHHRLHERELACGEGVLAKPTHTVMCDSHALGTHQRCESLYGAAGVGVERREDRQRLTRLLTSSEFFNELLLRRNVESVNQTRLLGGR